MKILLTGASGHLGYATTRELEKQVHEVVALVLPSSNLKGLEGTRAQIAYGDVLDPAAVRKFARDCTAIIHQAAVYRLDMDKPEEIIRPAVEGTRNVLEAASELGIKRVVYTSSIASIGASTSPDQLLDGTTWNTSTALPYAEAKTQSERIAHELARTLGLELMVMCPGAIMGPGDYRVTPSHGIILALTSGGPIPAGGFNPVSVFDVASLHVQALTRGVPFKRYVAASRDNITYRQTYDILRAIAGAGFKEAPDGEVGPAYYAYYNIAETLKDFQYDPMAARDALKSAYDWLTFTGALKL